MAPDTSPRDALFDDAPPSEPTTYEFHGISDQRFSRVELDALTRWERARLIGAEIIRRHLVHRTFDRLKAIQHQRRIVKLEKKGKIVPEEKENPRAAAVSTNLLFTLAFLGEYRKDSAGLIVYATREQIALTAGIAFNSTYEGLRDLVEVGAIRSMEPGGKLQPPFEVLIPPEPLDELLQGRSERAESELGARGQLPIAQGARGKPQVCKGLDPNTLEVKHQMPPEARAQLPYQLGSDPNSGVAGRAQNVALVAGRAQNVALVAGRAHSVAPSDVDPSFQPENDGARPATHPTHDHDHKHDHDYGHDHESKGKGGEAGSRENRIALLESISCEWKGSRSTLDKKGIYALLKFSKCTPTQIIWARRWLEIRLRQAIAERDESFSPMGYVFTLIRRGCDEPPTEQELAHKPPNRPRLPDRPPEISAAELAKMRAQADASAWHTAEWKSRASAPPATPTFASAIPPLPSAAVEPPPPTDQPITLDLAIQTIRGMSPPEREHFLARAVAMFHPDQVANWKPLQPIQVDAVRIAMCKLALQEQGAMR